MFAYNALAVIASGRPKLSDMIKTYTKAQFQALDLDTKCMIIEELLTDDYFNGQTEINFYIPPGYTGEENFLPETPPDIKKIEDEKFANLISRLTDKLFFQRDIIEF